MCSHNQLSTRLACIAQVASVIQPYIVLILLGQLNPGLPRPVDRRPNFCVDLFNIHRS